jgi:lactoylglutathione lyase
LFVGMAHTCIGVTDLDKMVGFYTNTLGMTVTGRRQMPTGATLVLVSTGQGAQIELTHNPAFSPREPAPDCTGLRHVAFYVDDIMATVSALKAKGISFYREPDPNTGSRVAFFKDPEGTDIELMQK